MLVPIIDDAHLMPTDCLRKLRLVCEDFPRSHNLVLVGQPPLMQSLTLSINEEIRSRVTYSALLPRLGPEAVEQFILDQLDRAGLGHNTFSPEALALIVRSGEGLLRRTRNLCLGSLIETVRDQTRIVDLKHVNRVLIQPHWRKDSDNPLPSTALVALANPRRPPGTALAAAPKARTPTARTGRGQFPFARLPRSHNQRQLLALAPA